MNSDRAVRAQIRAVTAKARVDLAARLLEVFKTEPMIDAVGHERGATLAALLSVGGATCLGVVAAKVREAFIERRAGRQLGRWVLWKVIDAIRQLDDLQRDRWPYVSEGTRLLMLKGSNDEMEQVGRAVIEAIRRRRSERLAA